MNKEPQVLSFPLSSANSPHPKSQHSNHPKQHSDIETPRQDRQGPDPDPSLSSCGSPISYLSLASSFLCVSKPGVTPQLHQTVLRIKWDHTYQLHDSPKGAFHGAAIIAKPILMGTPASSLTVPGASTSHIYFMYLLFLKDFPQINL